MKTGTTKPIAALRIRRRARRGEAARAACHCTPRACQHHGAPVDIAGCGAQSPAARRGALRAGRGRHETQAEGSMHFGHVLAPGEGACLALVRRLRGPASYGARRTTLCALLQRPRTRRCRARPRPLSHPTYPSVVVFEQVASLTTHFPGVWRWMRAQLEALPYQWEWGIFEAVHFGACNSRTRLLGVGERR